MRLNIRLAELEKDTPIVFYIQPKKNAELFQVRIHVLCGNFWVASIVVEVNSIAVAASIVIQLGESGWTRPL